MDGLSVALATMRLRSSLIATLEARAPWSVDCEDGLSITAYYILSGKCLFLPSTGSDVSLSEGDILMLPRWLEHRLCSARDVPSVYISKVAERVGTQIWNPDNPLGQIISLVHKNGGDDGPRVHIMTMLFRLSNLRGDSLLPCLPKIFHFTAESVSLTGLLSAVKLFITEEIGRKSVGYAVSAHKLAELLLIELLRSLVSLQPDALSGWLRGLGIPSIEKAITAMHVFPDTRWTVLSLATHAGMSRSAFAKKFMQCTDQPPMDYLRMIRMQNAADDLICGSSIQQIAQKFGYATQFGFQKAFTKAFGLSPGAWRKANSEN